jgi:hypothetical protein
VSPPRSTLSADAAVAAAGYFANRPAAGDFNPATAAPRLPHFRVARSAPSYFRDRDTPSDGRCLRARCSMGLWVLVRRSYTLLAKC